MVRCADVLVLTRTRVTFDCDDADLPEVLRCILDRQMGGCTVEDLKITPLVRPAWNVSFIQGAIPHGTLSPLDTMKRHGLVVNEKK